MATISEFRKLPHRSIWVHDGLKVCVFCPCDGRTFRACVDPVPSNHVVQNGNGRAVLFRSWVSAARYLVTNYGS